MFIMKRMNAELLGSLLLLGGASHHYSAAAVDIGGTYQETCELPSFEWANFGTRLTGRMYTRRAAYLNGSLYAAGYLKSTGAPDKEDFEESDSDFCLTGPYHEDDPTGFYGTVVCKDLVSYTTEHGAFAQFEVGVVKIDASTGEPQDIFVYYGEGQDETSGLAVKELDNGRELMAVSGHFVGSLTAEHSDGTKSTIFNSNAEGTADFVLHPNAIENGFDDGFVISADAQTGHANWMVAYPPSNKDAQTVGVDVDGQGNIYGAGYSCNQTGESAVVCDGFVAKFASNDGAVLWEKKFPDLGAAMWIAYDDEDDSLYVTGTTSYLGEATDVATDTKNHEHCPHDICGVTMRLSAVDGTAEWIRTTKGSPRWNYFDNTGDIELANEWDGPYVYVAMDDIAEDGVSSLDEGTSYAGCRDDADGALTPEYQVAPFRVMTEADCPVGSTFVPRSDASAAPASFANTGARCGAGHDDVDGCVMKYHKYTGLPVWGADVNPVTGLVPSADGESVMIAGYYWGNGGFDGVELPNYNGVEGSYNAKLNARSGKGEFVQHSGGIGKTRVYDIVGDASGDVYMVGYTQSAVVHWGGSLKTKIIEEGVDQNDDVGTAFQTGKVSSSTGEYQFFAVKLGAEASKAEPLSCVETCDSENNGVTTGPIVKEGSCLIDNVCYQKGETAELFGRSCLVCDPRQSQTEWSHGSEIGVDVCFIDNVCYDQGDAYSYRKSRSETLVSECQICEPKLDAASWSVKLGFQLVTGADSVEPPNDCLASSTSGPSNSSLRPPTNTFNPPTDTYNGGSTTASSFSSSSSPSGLSNGGLISICVILPIVLFLGIILVVRTCARKDTMKESDTMKDDSDTTKDAASDHVIEDIEESIVDLS